MKEGAIIVGATIAFAAFAWSAGTPREPPQECSEPEVIRFLPMPEVTPLVRPQPFYDWPILDRQRIEIEPEIVHRVAETDSAEYHPRRHRRHRRG